jgi:ABC-type transport system substrate-binding protein
MFSLKKAALVLCLAAIAAFALACGQEASPTPAPTQASSTPSTSATQVPGTSPTQAPAPTTAPAGAEAPESKNPAGTIVFAQSNLDCSPGAHSLFCAQYDAVTWGVGEDLFTWRWKEDGTIDYAFGQVAASFDMAPDFKSVVVEVRPGIQFHDGWGEMTAADVVATYNGVNPMITPYSIAPSAAYFSTLLGDSPAVAEDAMHVKFEFAAEDSHWHTYMMNTNGYVGTVIHPARALEEEGEEWMRDNFIGSGPFQVDSWARDDRAVFSKFADHWAFDPAIETVMILAMPETASRVAAMQTGEVDASELAVKDIPTLLDGGFETTSSGNASQQGIIFSGNLWEDKHALTGVDLNTASSGVYVNDLFWLGNPYNPNDSNNPEGMDDMEQARLVRWAVAMAINKTAINEQLLSGLGWPVHVGYADEKSPYWQEKWEYPYDVDMANQYLDQAGLPRNANGTRFSMPLFVDTGAQGGLNEEIMDAVSGMMSDIGLDSPVSKYPYAVYRPGLVERSAIIPRITAGDDGQTIFPFDWPKGIEESSLSRGGYCICYEAPEISQIYLDVAAEPLLERRIELNSQYFDFMYHWALKPGVVAIPQYTVYNPNSIQEWVMEPTPFGTSAFWNIVPAPR